jgi:hypothetical protein
MNVALIKFRLGKDQLLTNDKGSIVRSWSSISAPRRALLREHVKRIQARLWADGVEARRTILHGKLPEDVLGAHAFFASLHPGNDEQRRALETARDAFGTIDDDPQPRRSRSEPVAQCRPRMVLPVVLRLWPAWRTR